MKRFILFISILITVIPLKAQVNAYSFSASSGTYTTITGGTLLISGSSAMNSWVSSAITIPSFPFGGTNYTTVYVTSNGILSLGGSAPSTTATDGISTIVGSGVCICPFSEDLDRANSNANSEMRWQIVADEIVFQWKQMKRAGQSESFDFQVRLNTVNGAVKFVYNLNTNPTNEQNKTAEVGIRTSDTDYKNIMIGTGSETWASPLAGTAHDSKCRFTSKSPAKYFADGLTYTFTPSGQCSGTPAGGTAVASVTSGSCSASSVITLSGYTTGIGITYQWQSSPDGSAWSNLTGATGTTYNTSTISSTTSYRCITTCYNGNLSGNSTTATVSITFLTPTVSIAAVPSGAICAGTPVTFTATPTNGGTPTYQWKLNGINAGNNTSTYVNASLANGNTVTCVMTSNAGCTSPATATSNQVTMIVNPVVTPAVAIAPSPSGAICAGTSVTFSATPTNGGTPTYQWKLNGINAGNNASTYVNASLANGNTVTCVMTSNAGCASTTTATTSNVTMAVNPILTPAVSIAASATTICAGTSVTFTATPTNGGTPTYQWKLNGSNAGNNTTTFVSTSFANNDVITCVMTPNAVCTGLATATSGSVTMTVNPILTPAVSIAASATTICDGTPVTFTATPTNGGTTPAYQWKLNGTNISGATSVNYTSSSLANGNIISCILTSNASCLATATATSNGITMVVNPILIPAVSIAPSPSGTICAGTSVTFTATPTNGGTPSYQWILNGSNVGNNTTTYVNASLANGNTVTCVMTSNAGCTSTATATSGTVTISARGTAASLSVNNPVNCGGSGTVTVNDGSTEWVDADFSSLPDIATLNGNATLTSGYCQLTAASSNQAGSVVFDNPCDQSGGIHIDFDMLIGGGNHGEGMSVSYGNITSTSNYGETGDPGALVISFDTHNDDGHQPHGVYLYWKPTAGDDAPTPLTSFTSSSDFFRTNTWRHISIYINPAGKIHVKVDNLNVFVAYDLPQAFILANKSTWNIAFAGHTSSDYDQHAIDNVVIKTNENYEYSSNGTSYQSSNVFTLAAGTYAMHIRETGAPATDVNLGQAVITSMATPLAPAFISDISECSSSLPATLSVTPEGSADVDWYSAPSGGTLLQSGSPSYAAAQAGTFYAESRSGVGCISVSRTAVVLSVTPSVNAAISIAAGSNSYCENVPATFTANATNGGNAPVYQWYVSGTASGNNAPTFSYLPADGSVISCMLTSNASCVSTPNTTSGNISVNLQMPATTGLSIGDMIWYGTYSNDWEVPENWLVFNGGNTFSHPIDHPSATNNVIISNDITCMQFNPAVLMGSEPCNNVTIEQGKSITLTGNSLIDVKGNWLNLGSFVPGTGTIKFSGNSEQSIFPGNSAFHNMAIEQENSGSIKIISPALVSGNISFVNGIVTFGNSGSLTLSDSATCNEGTAHSFVSGPMSKTGDDAIIFPVGKIAGNDTIWAPLGMTAPANTADRFTCEYFRTYAPHNLDPSDMCDQSQLNHVSGIEYWDLNRDLGSSTPEVTLFWKNAAQSMITDISDIVVAHYTNCGGTLKWEAMQGTAAGTTGINGQGFVSGTGFTNYSPITFGSKNNANPLPVKLLDFSAECNGGAVLLKWATATETNNDHFTIERSKDAQSWQMVAQVNGAGNSNQIQNYSLDDQESIGGLSYYRLTQTDFDGRFETFSPVAVSCSENALQPEVQYFPNPFTSELVAEIKNYTNSAATLNIFDIQGKKVAEYTFETKHLAINLKELPTGKYIAELIAGDFRNSTILIKK
ncbi:MAG: T9SS type A sorting domain-containing protein [Bacteroidota bacterium]